MITVQPHGGLANRMRVINSAYLLSKKLQMPLKVIWESYFEINCPLNQLFLLPSDIEIIETYKNGFYKRVSDNLFKILRKAGIKLPPGYNLYFYDEDIIQLKEFCIRDKSVDIESVFIYMMHEFFNDVNSYSFKIFKPVTGLQDIINSITAKFTANTIGIHIRRSDNKLSTIYSPLNEFKRLIDNEISEYTKTRFFLATDSKMIENELIEYLGDKVIIHEKVLDRNTKKGSQDALIDLYCLGNTKKIIGSYYSSFSEVAAKLNNIDFYQVYKAG